MFSLTRACVALSLCVIAANIGRADTFYVNGACGDDAWSGRSPECLAPDGPKAHIQPALDAAAAGDAIVVADGIYTGPLNKNLDYAGKDLTLRSENGPELCIIDCEGNGRGVIFQTGESPAAVLDGFTIRRGSVTNDGGGIRCESSSPTIRNCVMARNKARHVGFGGGLYSQSGSPTLINCTVSGNRAWIGAGLVLTGSEQATMSGCVVERNWGFGTSFVGAGWGGGLYSDNSGLILDGCAFTGNQNRFGGGLFAERVALSMYDCSIDGNVATSESKGGVGAGAMIDGVAVLERCTFKDNRADDGGGGVAGSHASRSGEGGLILRDCLFLRNTVAEIRGRGGALYNAGGLMLFNCTLGNNSAAGGGALSNEREYSDALAINCIFWNNGQSEIANHEGANLTVAFSDVRGGWPGEGNIDAEPMFVDPANGDLHLAPGSPCIDAGDPAFASRAGGTDIDGQLRVWNGRVDMGADEFGSFVYGDMNCDGGLDAFDVESFILALTDPNGYRAMFPDCDIQLADLNGDGAVDAFDIEPFVSALTS